MYRIIELEEARKILPVLNREIWELELCVRAHNALMKAGIVTIKQLIREPRHRLMRLRNFGRLCISDVEEALAEKGLSLGMGDKIETLRGHGLLNN